MISNLAVLAFSIVLRANCVLQDDEDLGCVLFSSILYRHGDRTPVFSYPKDPYDLNDVLPYGSGQLTPTGMDQHYELGSFLRNRYRDFLPETYNVNDIRVSSTDFDRCLMSAQCNLYGLYSSNENITAKVPTQPIPVHTTSVIDDKILAAEWSCHKYTDSYANVKQSNMFKCIANVTKGVRQAVRKASGLLVEESHVHDVLFIEQLYNLTLPTWTREYYPEPLRSLYLLDFFLIPFSTRGLQRLSAGPLIGQIVKNMVAKSEDRLSPDRKISMYSAHDTTVSKLLLGLGVHNGMLVPYAASVLVELRTLSDQYYVTVSYKNSTDQDPHLLQVPQCDILCPLDSFVNLTESLIPDDLETECEGDADAEMEFRLPFSDLPEDWQACFNE